MNLSTIAEYAEAYRAGASVVEVITSVLARLAAAPPGVLIGPPLRSALDDARRLDAGPRDLPLFGVPFVVKDNIDVGGVPTTAGCPGYEYTAAADAVVVAALRAGGAVVVGKANLDQFATGLVGTRSPYGIPPNVVDPALVPGGSSSGSAVAVALGLVPFSLGTDTAGSGRVPAALNGIIGYKPSVGGWSTGGVVPAVRRLDCPSVFATTVEDAALVAAVIGPARLDDDAESGDAVTALATITVGVPGRWPASLDLDTEVVGPFAGAIERLASLEVLTIEVDVRPLLELGEMLYGSALVAERSAAVGDSIIKQIDGLDPTVERVIRRGFEYSAVDAYRAEEELRRRRRNAERTLDGVDILVMPTTAHLPTLAAVEAAPLGENERVGRLTTFANLLGRPVIVVPAATGRPVGVQLVGKVGGERLLVQFAGAFAATG